MFKRKVYDELKTWKDTYDGTYSVLIQGARRVGKSTVAESFAKHEYRSYIKIDFANMSEGVKDIFNDINNLDLFFLRLQAETNITLYERESVIIFDEIQLFPKVRQAIKYLVADHRYDYIETGSLISIKKNVKGIVLPSEEHKITMYPMDYEEFLWATGNSNYELIKKIVKIGKPIGNSTNRKLMRDFRVYMAVGGMPQAVEAYVQKKNFAEIDAIKREIIDLYKDDFKKIDSSGRISRIFKAIPSQLALRKKRFVISNATGKKKSTKDEELLSDLLDSKCALICNNVSSPGISLSQTKSDEEFKLYITDTGLFVTLLFNDESKAHEDIYKKMLSDKLSENLGYLYENAVAQILASAGKQLYYHTWRKSESTHSYEVDFLLIHNTKLVPIEVKSSRITPHLSIDNFSKKYAPYVGDKIIASQQDIGELEGIHLWPIYCLPALIED
ncbi:MAG: ATP-binding protein [Coriobacteriales bacterium]|nr:ATP-binding protein [Coriobacteriales bacterium]